MGITGVTPSAFDGAQGFGASATGGRGGDVIKVTNLNDSGVGSLRWALEDLEQPRIVVFEVSGTIDLRSEIEINGDVTLAGQTASDGITVTGGRLRVVESNVIIRGMHVRPGDEAGADDPSNRDGISVGKRGSTVEHVIIDSNSISWSVDELAATWGAPKGVTFSNNIFAEALSDSIHPEGNHSMGMLIGDGSSQVSIVGNLFAHNMYRNATVKDDAKQIEFVNNLIYNYGPNGFLAHEGTTAHIIGNVYIPGADSAGRAPIRLESPESSTAYYIRDNVGNIEGSATSKIRDSYVFTPATQDVLPASQVEQHVLEHAGARGEKGLDQIDARIIGTVRTRTGEIIDSPDDVGGYLQQTRTGPLPDRDDDGIPDRYEAIIGSNADRADAQSDADGDGYANIEDYINGLLDGFGGDGDGGSSSDGGGVSDGGNSAGGGGATPPGAPEMIFVEAEMLDLSSGFEATSLSGSSGGEILTARSDSRQSATMTFDGEDGVYRIEVTYYDESDGESTLAVSVDGREIDRWDWDKDLGDRLASNETRTTHTIDDVTLQAGDKISFAGTRDGDEPLRIDTIRFVPEEPFMG